MARISTYAVDGQPVSSDKLIGTDSSGTTTKNYPLGSVSDWLKESGASAVLGQNNYSFQIALDPNAGRLPGSFSFENYGGDGTEFTDVSRLMVSKSSSTGKYVGDYLLSIVGDRVMLGQLDDLNSFGVYTLVSLVQNPIEPTFYDAELLFVEGNGALLGNKLYGLAIYSASANPESAVWGSIEGIVTNQTDLVNYIDAEIAAIPVPITPTLQSVTDEGATTTNAIQVDGLTVTGTFKNYDEATPDIGAKQDNDLRGYGDKYISNKTIAYSRISSAAFNEEGAIRIKDNVFQTYIGGEWQDVPTGFRFRQDSSGNYEFEHKPTGFDLWIEVSSGNSDILGFNGLPLVQQYAVSMGAYPVPLQLDGGTF